MAFVLELVFTAEPITALRAYEIGFLNGVLPRTRLLPEAFSIANRIIKNALIALRYFKELVYSGQKIGSPELVQLIHYLYGRLLSSEDSYEGPQAFVDKRNPV